MTQPKRRSTLLTPRQQQILNLIGNGKSTKDIAAILNLNIGTFAATGKAFVVSWISTPLRSWFATPHAAIDDEIMWRIG